MEEMLLDKEFPAARSTDLTGRSVGSHEKARGIRCAGLVTLHMAMKHGPLGAAMAMNSAQSKSETVYCTSVRSRAQAKQECSDPTCGTKKAPSSECRQTGHGNVREEK